MICDLAVKDVNHESDVEHNLASSVTRVSTSIDQTIVSFDPSILGANAGRFNPTALSANIYEYLLKFKMLYEQYFQTSPANNK